MTDTEILYRDLRRLLDAIEALLERGASPIAAPIEQMLADLHAIQTDLEVCATAMFRTAEAVQALANRTDPTDEIARLHRRLDKMGVPEC